MRSYRCPRWWRATALVSLAVAMLVSCAGSESSASAESSASGARAEATPPAGDTAEPPGITAPATPKPEPERYVPAAPPGSAEAYRDLIARLEAEVPARLRGEIPWPDLRDADPIRAQIEIFDLWIWMAANLPEPVLAEVMAAPGSPSREEIVSVFGRLDRDGYLETRIGQPYQAFDHLVVTFESAGLPLWLARDVPEGAVVVYYSDNAGPTQVTDRETGAVIEVRPEVPTRAWLSIMVPTEVGWQLWRDQLIEPSDPELETPEFPPPGADGAKPLPEL